MSAIPGKQQITAPRAPAVYVTPAVRAKAEHLGVDLAKVKGTGPGGRVRLADVVDASAPAAVRPVAATDTRLAFDVKAPWDLSLSATINVLGANPLLELAEAVSTSSVALARREAPVPTLFVTGDLPVYLASGAEVTLLRQLPWVARHPAAMADQGTFARMLEDYPATEVGYLTALMDGLDKAQGNQDYVQRMRHWLSGLGRTLEG